MFNKRGIKILYLGIEGLGIGRSLNNEKNIKSEVKCIRAGNTVSFYKIYSIFVNEISISIINIARTNYKSYREVIEKEISNSDNVLIIGDSKRKNKIKEYIEIIKDSLNNFIDVDLNDNFIARSKELNKEVLNKEIMSFFIRKLLVGDLKKKGSIYLTPVGDVKEYGKTVYTVLKEYNELQYVQDLRIGIICDKEFDMNDLTYIIDPIQEYINPKSCIEINNIVNEKKGELYFLILGIN